MELQSVNLHEIEVKAQSKSKFYRILLVECQYYLPLQKEYAMIFISQIAINEKKVAPLLPYLYSMHSYRF